MKYLLLAAIDFSPLPQPTGAANGSVIDTIINLVLSISAAVALLIIVIAGFRYIVASGDPQRTAEARKTIIYASIGLAVIAAAYSIVTFAVRGIS